MRTASTPLAAALPPPRPPPTGALPPPPILPAQKSGSALPHHAQAPPPARENHRSPPEEADATAGLPGESAKPAGSGGLHDDRRDPFAAEPALAAQRDPFALGSGSLSPADDGRPDSSAREDDARGRGSSFHSVNSARRRLSRTNSASSATSLQIGFTQNTSPTKMNPPLIPPYARGQTTPSRSSRIFPSSDAESAGVPDLDWSDDEESEGRGGFGVPSQDWGLGSRVKGVRERVVSRSFAKDTMKDLETIMHRRLSMRSDD